MNVLKRERSPAMQSQDSERKVYVVANWPGGGNDRVKKIVRLRSRFAGLVLVTPGPALVDDDSDLMVPPLPNPLGVLRLLGLNRVKWTIERYLYYPSISVLFIERVKRRLVRRIAADLAAGREVTLLTAVPPHALGLLGLYVKRHCPGVRWVMDWQDLWTYDENYFLPLAPVHRKSIRRLEQKMLDTADLNVTTNANAARVLEEHYRVDPARLTHIHHHFDRDDFVPAQRSPAEVHDLTGGRVLRIGFLGTLFKPPRVPGMELVRALADCRSRGLNVELHVHGHVPDELRPELSRTPGVVLHGRTSHVDSVSRLAAYDYLLLLLADLDNARAVMSIKLPHYMITGRPIIAIVPADSAVAGIVENTGTGFVLPVEGPWRAQLEQTLRDVSPTKAAGRRIPERIDSYAWSEISGQWLAALRGDRDLPSHVSEPATGSS